MQTNGQSWIKFGAAAIALIMVTTSSYAHHSRSNFNFGATLELEGTISSFEFRNPHTFLSLEVTADSGEVQEWLLAGNSTASLKSAGWAADTFAIGEQVKVVGNPDRNEGKRLLFLEVITKLDGSNYASGKIAPGGRPSASVAEAEGSKDFTGVWQPPFNPRGVAANFQVAQLPMTEKGQPFIDAYDEGEDPALDCEADATPMTVLPVYPMQITRSENELHMHYEQFDGRRVVYLGLDEHPVDTSATHMGHSIGSIDGNVLTVDTRYFAEDRWGLGRGAPSGLGKHVVERYTLADDGMTMAVEYTFEDPEYLIGSVTESGSMAFRPDYTLEEWDCDATAARRHLSVD
ncbi:MAG: hypothetical protein HOJ88_06095 [Proteobacteria bacterium]|nr:hypothetical protein [Pseudomonadota bacterium]